MTQSESCPCGTPSSAASLCHIAAFRLWRSWFYPAALSSTLLLGACTTVAPGPEAGAGATASVERETTQAASASRATTASITDQTIADDLVGVALQIFNPFNTTLQFNTSEDDPLMQYFISRFSDEGYGIQRVLADQGSNLFSYDRIEESTSSGDTLVRFNSAIGVVQMARDYTIPSPNIVSPASTLRLSGTRASVVIEDVQTDRMSLQNADFSRVNYVASLNLDEQAPPVISLITSDLVDRVADQNVSQSSLQALNSERMEVSNLFYSDQSNFTSVLDDYEQFEEQLVVFGNDSMILGNTNKLLIEQLVREKLQPDDIISLVGCSNGPTALEIGNEGLALGRAERVTQALLSQGVPRDRILDEGCWAPVSAGEKYPGRGVVMELWRRSS